MTPANDTPKRMTDAVLDYFEDMVKKREDLPLSDQLKLIAQAREANALGKALAALEHNAYIDEDGEVHINGDVWKDAVALLGVPHA